MTQRFAVHSEVGKLRTVLVCRPGLAHQRLTPGKAVRRFASATGKRAAIGALADFGRIIVGEAGTAVSTKESGIVYAG